MEHDPLLRGLDDKIPVLRVLATRIRDGRLSRSGNPVRGAHVADEISLIAKTFQELGAPDPRYNQFGQIDLRLSSLYKAYRNIDPAPNRVKPMPIQILHRAQEALLQFPHLTDIRDSSAMDMIWIAYFFLLRPGEYVQSRENKPLTLGDVTFMIGANQHPAATTHQDNMHNATHVTITFDDQKNRERGEVIGHRRSGEQYACPVLALYRRCAYLRYCNADASTPLCTYYREGRNFRLNNKNLESLLKHAALTLPELNYSPRDIVPRSLRSGGAMALLCGRVDKNIIQLVGRWKSDAIFRYLHAQALPLIADLSRTMVRHGAYTLLPGTTVPPQALPILDEEQQLLGAPPPPTGGGFQPYSFY